MPIRLLVPSGRAAPLLWVADIVFGEMLGVSVEITEVPDTHVSLTADGRTLVMASIFPDLAQNRAEWAKQVPMPPLREFDPAASGLRDVDLEAPLPVLFGRPQIEVSEHEIRCEIDILGAIFFMLSRFEEVVLTDRDKHDRFPATASLAWNGGFLYRPIVDEYVEVLWAMMKRLWPSLTRKRHHGNIRVSCDVDFPFDETCKSQMALLRSVAGDLGKRRNPGLALRRARNFVAHRRGDYRFDPHYTFDWYMDVCERHGHQAAFYFISDHTAGAIDGSYDLEERRILALISCLAQRGHEIGLHGSYNTYRDGAQIAKERDLLRRACKTAAVDSMVGGNRQHYLRWDTTVTPDHLDEAGFAYDTTGSFADRPGFRYGTSHTFPMWSWQRFTPLSLRQAPLVLMECSVISPNYLAMGYSPEARGLMLKLKRRAMKRGGNFTLLWHNSHFLTQEDRDVFSELVQ